MEWDIMAPSFVSCKLDIIVVLHDLASALSCLISVNKSSTYFYVITKFPSCLLPLVHGKRHNVGTLCCLTLSMRSHSQWKMPKPLVLQRLPMTFPMHVTLGGLLRSWSLGGGGESTPCLPYSTLWATFHIAPLHMGLARSHSIYNNGIRKMRVLLGTGIWRSVTEAEDYEERTKNNIGRLKDKRNYL